MLGLNSECPDGDESHNVPSHEDEVGYGENEVRYALPIGHTDGSLTDVANSSESGGKTEGVDHGDGVGAPTLQGESLGSVLVGEDFSRV